jgi:8-oxo-dGTP pyrophosphatase MutT (NUDIX family)
VGDGHLQLRDLLDPYRGAVDDPTAQPGGWLASVALVLRYPLGQGAEVLLIRRSHRTGDPWSGHMALPGGRKDPEDDCLLSTAIRETREEVDLCLDRSGEPLGRLRACQPLNQALPRFTLLPFVFQAPPFAEARVASAEVSEVLWVPLRALRDPENQTSLLWTGGGEERILPAIRFEGRTIWGLTHQILGDLVHRLDEGANRQR